MSAAPASASTRAGVSSAITWPSRISSSRSQRSASSMTWLETTTACSRVGQPVEQRPEVAAQHRVQADGRLVEDEHLGLAQQGDREADPRPLAAAQAADHLAAGPSEVDRGDAALDILGAGAEHPREEAEVLGDAEVVVHAGGLGDVADPVTQRLGCRPAPRGR